MGHTATAAHPETVCICAQQEWAGKAVHSARPFLLDVPSAGLPGVLCRTAPLQGTERNNRLSLAVSRPDLVTVAKPSRHWIPELTCPVRYDRERAMGADEFTYLDIDILGGARGVRPLSA